MASASAGRVRPWVVRLWSFVSVNTSVLCVKLNLRVVSMACCFFAPPCFLALSSWMFCLSLCTSWSSFVASVWSSLSVTISWALSGSGQFFPDFDVFRDLCWLRQFLGLRACSHCPCIPVRMRDQRPSFSSLFWFCSCVFLRWPFGLRNLAVLWFRRVSPEVVLLAACSCATVGL